MMTTSHGIKQANALLRPKIGALFFTGMLVLLLTVPNGALANEPVTVGDGQLLSDCDSAYDEAGEEALRGESGDQEAQSSDEEVLEPTYDTCLTIAGACEVATTTSTETAYIKVGWGYGAFFGAGYFASSSKTVTTITCEGTYLFTATYSGGIGLYQGQSTVLLSQTFEGDHVEKRGTDSKSCTYVAYLGKCTTSHRNEWGGEVTYSGKPPSQLAVCVNADIVVDENLLKLPYLGTTGYEEFCFNALALVADGDAALGLVNEHIGTSA